jgi:UDP-glucose 4-epimerase
MRKIILVTGGAGFIGSNLCAELVKDEKNKVIVLDNYLSGTRENHIEGVEYIEGETSNIENLIKTKPEIVYHLGEYSRVEKSFIEVDLIYKSNVIGTFSVLEFCRKNNSKLIYAGSSTKFGDMGIGREQSPYAWSKAMNTDLVKKYGEWYSIKYAITYFYNAYGPGEIRSGKYATLIGIFMQKSIKQQPLPVVMPGTQIRNFTHVQDIVDGLMKVGKDGIGDNYGIGSETAYSIIEVAKLFGGEIEWLPERKGNRMTADLMTEKTKQLGWKEKKSLEKFIKEFNRSK